MINNEDYENYENDPNYHHIYLSSHTELVPEIDIYDGIAIYNKFIDIYNSVIDEYNKIKNVSKLVRFNNVTNLSTNSKELAQILKIMKKNIHLMNEFISNIHANIIFSDR